MACIIEDGILKPCSHLDRAMDDDANSRREGVSLMVLRDFKGVDFKVSRTCAVLRSGKLGANGCVVNFRPFCGVSIAHHMEAKTEGQEVPNAHQG